MPHGTNTIDGRKLLGYVERVEHVEAEVKGLKEDVKVIVAEAERDGFSAKGIRFCVKARAQKPREFEENEALRDAYLHGIGMAEEPPLFRQLDAYAGEQLTRDALVERFKELVPSKGEITLKLEGGPATRFWRDKDGKAHSAEVKPQAPSASRAAPIRGARPEAPEVPDVDDAGAEALGGKAARDNEAIITNPFPFGDTRRARFDVGWRKENGGDGMGPDD
jgi:uncharacterized protein (UPF0335 family)